MSDVRAMLSAKLDAYYGLQREEKGQGIKYENYTEAKEAGDVKSMIAYKFSGTRSNRIMALSNSIFNTHNIIEIQQGIKEYEKEFKAKKKLVSLLKDEQVAKFKEEFSEAVVGEMHINHAVDTAMDEWMRTDMEYLEAVSDFENADIQYRAYCNAKDMYIEENKALIEAEAKRVKREQLLKSGVLEELGLVYPVDAEEDK